MTNSDKVKQFMTTFGQDVQTEPKIPDPRVVDLRVDLIEEELNELLVAVHDPKLGYRDRIIEIADALTDILYVTYGAGHAFGIDLDKCFEEVHNSNMSKLEDGKPIYREDGKVMKGKDYFQPNLRKVVYEDQGSQG